MGAGEGREGEGVGRASGEVGGCKQGNLVELRRGREAERNSLRERVNETIWGGGRDAVFGRDIMIPISF